MFNSEHFIKIKMRKNTWCMMGTLKKFYIYQTCRSWSRCSCSRTLTANTGAGRHLTGCPGWRSGLWVLVASAELRSRARRPTPGPFRDPEPRPQPGYTRRWGAAASRRKPESVIIDHPCDHWFPCSFSQIKLVFLTIMHQLTWTNKKLYFRVLMLTGTTFDLTFVTV